MIIAIDGPAAAGKGTIARALATALEFAYLDTGLLYRAVGLKSHDEGVNPVMVAGQLTGADLEDPRLRSDKAAALASKVAALHEVREALLAFQRHFAQHKQQKGGVVLDGRDIGSVVCPQADIKFFITASLEKRVQRRLKELHESGMPAIEENIRAEMIERDERDKNRQTAPLVCPADAYLVDTSELSVEEVLSQVIDRVKLIIKTSA